MRAMLQEIADGADPAFILDLVRVLGNKRLLVNNSRTVLALIKVGALRRVDDQLQITEAGRRAVEPQTRG